LCQGELVDGKDVFLQNSFVSCETDFSIPSNVAIL
jgi:hypothetical protein